ncbi:MAG TPA: PEP/pyruvate-binding domain-containing protein [Syntrophomonas sp.]|nr:PEP/pyruvate-binding domain-containing protein [Syntrophomonas sp.]
MWALDHVSTGVVGLDRVLDGLRWGDNVVWQVEDILDYRDMAVPFVQHALAENCPVVYIRFGQHEPLLAPHPGIKEYRLDAGLGFEAFSSRVHAIATEEGEGVCYVFDSLSDLLSAWATDLMIGNFFHVTCPYLFKLNTIAYFALIKNRNTYATIARIRETTQLLLDFFRTDDYIYVHPLKVWNRYSPTMFLPHIQRGEDFVPITSSAETAQYFSRFQLQGPGNVERKIDYWDRIFLEAQELMGEAALDPPAYAERTAAMVEKLCRMILGRDEYVLTLAHRYFSLEDLMEIRNRLVGSGFIGGKAVGMLLARKILESDNKINWSDYLEPHDSFYIGSDVYYTYLVENQCWEMRQQQKSPDHYFPLAQPLREKMIGGSMPEVIIDQFKQMLDYFGQSPIIVRSSSLLEDGFGNAFAGKYESIFCINQGNPQQRYLQFEEAVKSIYASTMNEDALAYRLQRGMADSDEQMALLVQRVSGSLHNGYFFPDLAGVALSYNPYTWREDMDPRAGMARLVLGLGTRAVDRGDDDYPRILALDKPSLRPDSDPENIGRFSQHRVDLLDLAKNEWSSENLTAVAGHLSPLGWWKTVAAPDYRTIKRFQEMGRKAPDLWILTFDEFLKGQFPVVMGNMLQTLEGAYDYPVDIEFTVNFDSEDAMRINLLQCRPLQTNKTSTSRPLTFDVGRDRLLFSIRRNAMGGSLQQKLERVIYVQPEAYLRLAVSDKYQVARLVGRLNRLFNDREKQPFMLMGPGRWGSSTPSLGIPVSFAEICNAAVLVEVAREEEGLMPELSFGTHFFQDLVETRIFYGALFPMREEVIFNPGLLEEFNNQFAAWLPEYEKWQEVIKVYDIGAAGQELWLDADMHNQQTRCFLQ